MAGGIDDIERKPFDCKLVAFAKPHRDHVGLGLFTHHGDAMGAVAQRPKACDVVGMQVRVHRLNQLQVELFHELQIAIDLLQHRIDDQRLAARPAGEEIGVGAGCLIKELTEHHGATFSAIKHTDVGFTCVQAATKRLPFNGKRPCSLTGEFCNEICEGRTHGGPAIELRRLHSRQVGWLRGFVSVSDCRRRELSPAFPRKRELTGCAQLG